MGRMGVLLLASISIACGSSSRQGGSSSGATTSGSGGATGATTSSTQGAGGGAFGALAFVGSYDATYMGTYSQTTPTAQSGNNGGNATLVAEASDATHLKLTTIFGSDATGTTCAALLTVGADGVAKFEPAQQSCNIKYDNGGTQTNTNTGDASLAGPTLTFHVDGSYTGVINAVPYAGTFQGTWTGTRK
jgi:hypothetical protein